MPRANSTNKTEEAVKATEEVKDTAKDTANTSKVEEGVQISGTVETTEKKEDTKPEVKEEVKSETAEKSEGGDKDQIIADLQAKLAQSESEKGALAELVQDQQKQLESPKIQSIIDTGDNGGDMAVASNTKAKLYKVKFLKDHSFTFGHTDIRALKDQVKEVDLNTMNKLAGRGIAVSIG